MTLSQAFDKFEEEYGEGSTVLMASANGRGNEPVHIVYGGQRIMIYILGEGGIVGMCDKRGKA